MGYVIAFPILKALNKGLDDFDCETILKNVTNVSAYLK